MLRTRIPLLKDWHTHPLLYAALLEGVNLESVDSREQSLALIRAQAKGAAGWTIAYRWNNGRYALEERDLADLPGPVVVFNLSFHGLLLNAAGRQWLSREEGTISSQIDDPHWLEKNLRHVLNKFARADASVARLQRFFAHLLAEHGVYYAEEMLLVEGREVELFEEAGLIARTRFWADPEDYEALPPCLQSKVHGIKLFTDGALGVWTAALHANYRDKPQAGLLIYELPELAALLSKYLQIGKPIAAHAIGDRAIDLLVEAIEQTRRHETSEIRIEHAQLISEDTARRAKRLGVKLCMQPNFSEDSVCYAGRLPADYAARNNPFRMLIDRVGFVPGEDLLFGSDGMPHGVAAALRQALFPAYEQQRLTLEEFVAGYCWPDMAPGWIEVEIDSDRRQVDTRIVEA